MNGRKMAASSSNNIDNPEELLKILLHDIDGPISLLKDSSLEDNIINEENIATIIFKIYWDNAQYQQKKPTPQANQKHCLRPSVEKQVFRTWLRLKT